MVIPRSRSVNERSCVVKSEFTKLADGDCLVDVAMTVLVRIRATSHATKDGAPKRVIAFSVHSNQSFGARSCCASPGRDFDVSLCATR
jgi:hypothetical protein